MADEKKLIFDRLFQEKQTSLCCTICSILLFYLSFINIYWYNYNRTPIPFFSFPRSSFDCFLAFIVLTNHSI